MRVSTRVCWRTFRFPPRTPPPRYIQLQLHYHHNSFYDCLQVVLTQAAAGGEDDQDGLLGLRLRQQGAARHSRDPHRLPQEDRHQVTWRSQLALFFTFTTLEARKIMHPIHFLRNNKRRHSDRITTPDWTILVDATQNILCLSLVSTFAATAACDWSIGTQWASSANHRQRSQQK